VNDFVEQVKRVKMNFKLTMASVALLSVAAVAAPAARSGKITTMNEFVEVFERIRANYVDKIDDKTLIKGAIDGMLNSLDPHSSYLEGSDVEQMRITTDGNYGGLGLSVSMEDKAVRVIAPQEGTPADKMGIKAGDYITHLDGVLLYGSTLDEAVNKMRGVPGTSIRLTIVRAGRDKPFDVTVTRQKIVIKPVTWKVMSGVGIININGFSKPTAQMVRDAVAGIDKTLGKRPSGYVIDLRSNPGGLLDQAIDVSDVFLEGGEVVSQRGRRREDIERYYATPGDYAGGLPIVVLVDAGSASAAEIVAGALQDHHRAIVMGERSFGKGSVQSLIDLGDKTELRLTTARYYTPSGRSVQEGGIKPDIAVPQLSDPDYSSRPRFREADLGRHLINDSKVDNTVLESDTKPDPRFTATPEQLKAKGIDDFQLSYAVQTVSRLGTGQVASSAALRKGGR
jgi:carboxyl-terminal processing protease